MAANILLSLSLAKGGVGLIGFGFGFSAGTMVLGIHLIVKPIDLIINL